MSFQSASSESYDTSSNSDEPKSDINYALGVQTLNRHQKWTLSKQEIPLDLVQYISISSNVANVIISIFVFFNIGLTCITNKTRSS